MRAQLYLKWTLAFAYCYQNVKKFSPTTSYPTKYFGVMGRDVELLVTPELWIPVRSRTGKSQGISIVLFMPQCQKISTPYRFLLYNDDLVNTQLFKLDATFTERNGF